MTIQTPMNDTAASTASWQNHRLSGNAGGHTGNLDIRFMRNANELTFMTEQYMITGNGSRNSANINIQVRGNGGGQWSVNSPDDRKQDHNWHAWNVRGSIGLGSSNKLTVSVEFVFDMGGPDDRVVVTGTYDV